MDSRNFKVTLQPSQVMGTELSPIDVEAEDVVVSEGFVIFIRVNNEDETTETVAMFNQNQVQSVMEVKTND